MRRGLPSHENDKNVIINEYFRKRSPNGIFSKTTSMRFHTVCTAKTYIFINADVATSDPV